MSIPKKLMIALAFAVMASTAYLGSVQTADAQSRYRNMSCYQLWYARNAIYARAGHCFRTRRGRRVFGRRCYPPYGRLSYRARRHVAAIQRWERRRYCR